MAVKGNLRDFSVTQLFNLINLTRTNAGDKNDKELGLLLINAGYLSQQDVLAGIREYLLASVYRLFTWSEGHFRFDNDVLPPEDRITLRLDLENIIMEGTRQLQEHEQLIEEIPNLDMALNFVERPGATL